ncbi:MAG: hypothetical protein K8R90_03060 [Candidatus Cloacimonetes bacterium]|nr:hypothetical protein [Candidatus Cloacimonadota bacterium]
MRCATLVLLLSLAACGAAPERETVVEPAGATPVRIHIFAGGQFAGSVSVAYNGARIDHLRLDNAEGEMVLHMAPGVATDSVFTCRWSLRSGGFGGRWQRLDTGGSRYEFDEGAPVRQITTSCDSVGRPAQALYRLKDETIELAGFCFDANDRPLSCVALDTSDYDLPGGRLEWQYDSAGRLASQIWDPPQRQADWRVEVEYEGEGEVSPTIWRDIDRCLWLPLPILAQHLGL